MVEQIVRSRQMKYIYNEKFYGDLYLLQFGNFTKLLVFFLKN